jgi:nucleoside-diphosphate-sugar epimerase
LTHPWFSYIHTVDFNHDQTKVVVSSSGFDLIQEWSLESETLTGEWLAWENGFNEALDPLSKPMPDAEIPFVDADDIADVVTKVLVDDSYNGQILTVTGPEKRTFKEVVSAINKTIDREIAYIPVSITEFKDGMKAAGLPDSYVWLFGYLFEEVLGNPENQAVSDDVERVLGRKATSFEAYVRKTMATGVWNQPVAQGF